MKKTYPHTELHPIKKCTECNKPIKRRLVEQKTKPVRLCYKCWRKIERANRSNGEYCQICGEEIKTRDVPIESEANKKIARSFHTERGRKYQDEYGEGPEDFFDYREERYCPTHDAVDDKGLPFSEY